MAEAALHRLEVTCQAENSLGNTASDIATQIQYGPETVDISGPTEIIHGEDSVFTCSVPLSFPSANIVWTRVISDLEETVSNQDIVTQVSSLLHGVSTRSQYRMYAAPPGVSSLSVYCTVNIPQIGVNMDSDTVEVTLTDLPDQVQTSESDEAGISKEDVSKTEVEATIQLVEQESNDKHQEEDVSMEKNGADISGEGDENINMNEFIETSANDLITTDVAEMELNEIGWHKLSDYNQKEEVAVNADTPHQEYVIDSGIEDVLGEEEEENEDLLGDNFSDYRKEEELEISADKYDQEYLTDSDIEDILDKERDEYDAENFNSEEDDENEDIFDDEGSDYRQDEESEMSADMHDQEYLTDSEIEEHVEDNEETFSGEEDDKNENISDDENDGENHTDLEEEGQIDGDDYDEYVKDVTDQADEDMSEMDNYEDYEENYIASEEKLQNSNNEVYETADNDSEMESSAEVEEEDSTDIKINDDHESNVVEENDSITEYDSTEEDDKYKDIEREGFVEYAEGKEEDKIDETKNAIDNVPSELELEDTTEDGSTENYGKKYSEENYKGEKSSENLNIGEAITKKSSLEEYSFDEKEGSAATELEQEVFSQLDTEENTEQKTDIDAAFQEESNIEDSDNDNSNVGTAVILEPVEEDDWNQEDASTMESEVHHNSNTEDDLKTYNAEITYSRGKQESYDFSSVFLPEPEQPQVFLRPEPERIEVQMRSADGPELTADMGSSWALHTDSSGPRLTSDVTTLICSVLTLLYIVCHITSTV